MSEINDREYTDLLLLIAENHKHVRFHRLCRPNQYEQALEKELNNSYIELHEQLQKINIDKWQRSIWAELSHYVLVLKKVACHAPGQYKATTAVAALYAQYQFPRVLNDDHQKIISSYDQFAEIIINTQWQSINDCMAYIQNEENHQRDELSMLYVDRSLYETTVGAYCQLYGELTYLLNMLPGKKHELHKSELKIKALKTQYRVMIDGIENNQSIDVIMKRLDQVEEELTLRISELSVDRAIAIDLSDVKFTPRFSSSTLNASKIDHNTLSSVSVSKAPCPKYLLDIIDKNENYSKRHSRSMLFTKIQACADRVRSTGATKDYIELFDLTKKYIVLEKKAGFDFDLKNTVVAHHQFACDLITYMDSVLAVNESEVCAMRQAHLEMIEREYSSGVDFEELKKVIMRLKIKHQALYGDLSDLEKVNEQYCNNRAAFNSQLALFSAYQPDMKNKAVLRYSLDSIENQCAVKFEKTVGLG